ncbi:MAG: glycosyltransferase [Panacibacter sp.]
MNTHKIRLALLSPELQAETFIMAHKQLLPFDVRHYYGGGLPAFSEQDGALVKPGVKGLLQTKGRNVFFLNNARLTTKEKAVARSFKENKIDVVLAEYGTTGARILNVCEAMQLPLIVYFFGYDAWVHKVYQQYNAAYNRLFAYADKVLAVSKSISERLTNIGCPSEKIIYSACAPDDDFFSLIPLYNQNLVLATGRFTDKKAPYYTILAFKKVLQQIPSAKLVICGDGLLWETCHNMVKYFGIEKSVSLPGRITRQQSMHYLSHTSVFVQHSVTATDGDREGTPVAILEACAAGIPVVSTMHSGIPEIIEDGVTGFLVAEHDVDAMAEKIIYLLNHKEEAVAMGAAGRKNATQHFSMQQHIDTVADTIKAACVNRMKRINA